MTPPETPYSLRLSRIRYPMFLFLSQMGLLLLAGFALSTEHVAGYVAAAVPIAAAGALLWRQRRGAIVLDRDVLTVTGWTGTRTVDLARSPDVRIEGAGSDVELVAAAVNGWVRVPLLVDDMEGDVTVVPASELTALTDVLRRNRVVAGAPMTGSQVEWYSNRVFGGGWVVRGPAMLDLLRDQATHLAAAGGARESPMCRWKNVSLWGRRPQPPPGGRR